MANPSRPFPTDPTRSRTRTCLRERRRKKLGSKKNRTGGSTTLLDSTRCHEDPRSLETRLLCDPMIPRTFIFFNGRSENCAVVLPLSLYWTDGRRRRRRVEWRRRRREGSYLPSSTLLLSWPLLSLFPFSSGVPRATEEGGGGEGGSHLTCASVNLGHGGGFAKTTPVYFWLPKVALLDSGAPSYNNPFPTLSASLSLTPCQA